MSQEGFTELIARSGDSLRLSNGRVEVTNLSRLRSNIDGLVRTSVGGSGEQQARARFLIRAAAQDQGIIPSSIHDLYLARGRGEVPPNFTVPAMNLRGLSYYAARAVFRVANRLDVGALIFEIARSEIGYTDQRPAEYATNVLAAALREGFEGPVFIQGDHFQISAKRYENDPEFELQAVESLTAEALAAGFYNIDIDTSTLVDLSKPTVPEQQALNAELTARFTRFIRELEPEGVTVSIGGEIGEVGGRNSTAEELRAYMDGFQSQLDKAAPGTAGLSKISIQTGTSHGGVVLPDGSIAEVNVDFETLLNLSQIARQEYGLAGAVQHGASTLPEDAFGKFAECEACEVHLATNFQTMMYDRLPDDLLEEIYAYLDENHDHERKPDWTDEQFYYKTQKRAIGPFKDALWSMDRGRIEEISLAWEETFQDLFERLQVTDTRKYVDQTVRPVPVAAALETFLGDGGAEEDTSDLAD